MTEHVKKQLNKITLESLRDTAELGVLVTVFVACVIGTV